MSKSVTPTTEGREALGELTADRAAADDPEPGRQIGQCEDGLVGEKTLRSAAGNGWHHGTGAGRDDGLAEVETCAVHVYRVGRDESTFADEDVHPEVLEPLGSVYVTDVGAELAHALHHRAEVAGPLRGRAAEALLRPTRGAPGPGGPDNRLRRHAAVVEAVPAHHSTLDQSDPGAQTGGSGGRDQPRGAPADHHQVIALGRLRIAPLGRMHMAEESTVVLVERLDQGLELWIEDGLAVELRHCRSPA